MTTVIDLFWQVVDDAVKHSPPSHPLRSSMHPLRSSMHPLRSSMHPLRSSMHPANSSSNPNKGVVRIQELKRLLEEYFPGD